MVEKVIKSHTVINNFGTFSFAVLHLSHMYVIPLPSYLHTNLDNQFLSLSLEIGGVNFRWTKSDASFIKHENICRIQAIQTNTLAGCIIITHCKWFSCCCCFSGIYTSLNFFFHSVYIPHNRQPINDLMKYDLFPFISYFPQFAMMISMLDLGVLFQVWVLTTFLNFLRVLKIVCHRLTENIHNLFNFRINLVS